MTAVDDAREVTHLGEVARALSAEFDAALSAYLAGTAEPDWLGWAKRLASVLGRVTAELPTPHEEVMELLEDVIGDAIAYREMFPAGEPGRVREYRALARALRSEDAAATGGPADG